MAKRSKAYQAAAAKIEEGKFYAPADAVALAKELAEGSKSDPTVEVAMRLGVDPRKADQMVRGTVNLPTAPVRPLAWSSSQPVTRLRLLKQPAPTTWVPTT